MSDASWIMPFDGKLLTCIRAAPPTVGAAPAVRASRTAPTDTRTLPGSVPAAHRTKYLSVCTGIANDHRPAAYAFPPTSHRGGETPERQRRGAGIGPDRGDTRPRPPQREVAARPVIGKPDDYGPRSSSWRSTR